MPDKILGVALLGLSGASHAFITHQDTALFFSVVYFALGTFEFIRGEILQRKG